jgi:hypothetical protein
MLSYDFSLWLQASRDSDTQQMYKLIHYINWLNHESFGLIVISSPCGTATAQSFANIAFIKFTGAKLD